MFVFSAHPGYLLTYNICRKDSGIILDKQLLTKIIFQLKISIVIPGIREAKWVPIDWSVYLTERIQGIYFIKSISS